MLLSTNTVFICSPSADQTIAITRVLRRYLGDCRFFAVTLHKGLPLLPKQRSLYDGLVPLDPDLLGSAQSSDHLVIPTDATSTRRLLESRTGVTLGRVTLTRAALRLFDKLWLVEFAKENSVPVPETQQAAATAPTFPIFYKERYEKGGGVRGVAKTPVDIPTENHEDLILQEYIDSIGTYGVGFLAQEGELLVAYTHYERESIPKQGGSAVVVEQFSDPRLIEYTHSLVKALAYSGWGLAEFKYCPRRQDYVLMEINAKFWASCEFAFINEPLFLRLLFGVDSRERPVQRMVFIDRALARGPLFVLTHLRYFAHRSELRMYPGWPYKLASLTVPRSARRVLKKLLLDRS